MKLLLLKMPFQTELRIETNCHDFISRLRAKYGKYVMEIEDDKKDNCDVIVLGGDGEDYEVTIKDISLKTPRPVHHITRFIFDHPTYDPNILAWHGAAVEYKENSYIFLAPTTTGKTTLTAYLLSLGFGYITDDCVLLDRSTLEIHPFSTPLHLREGSVEVLKNNNVNLGKLMNFSEQGIDCRYAYTPKKIIDRALPIGEIFIMERTQNENSLSSMSSNEKISSYFLSPITEYPITADYIRLLSQISKKYGKHLKYCDMNFVREVIDEYAR